MNDLGTGVYTYSYTVTNEGKISVSVLLYTSSLVATDYYGCIDFTCKEYTFGKL